MERKIVFYDGDCGLCNRTVQWILKYEKSPELFFCALQSEAASSFFAQKQLPQPDMSTMVFYNGEKCFTRSTAVLRILYYLRFPASLLKFGWIAPRFVRDAVYNFVAKRRQKFAKSNCFVPTLKERQRFLTEAL